MLFLACALSCVLSSYARAQAPAQAAAPAASLSSSNRTERLTALEDARAGRSALPGAALWKAWETETDPLVQARLLRALARVEGAAAVVELTAAVRFAASPTVRQAAAQELGNYAANAAVARALADGLAADAAPEVRYACAASLALAKGPAAIAALDGASRQGDPDLRRQAAFSLRRHSGAEAKKILKRLESDGDASVRRTAGGKAK